MHPSTVMTEARRPRAAKALAAGLLAVLALAAGRAGAAACGDDVAGERVPCRCGDTVVSDTVLWAGDPVASQTCNGDALVLAAPPSSDGITLNLGGLSLVGTGSGAGIRVVSGGRLGSTIVGGDDGDARATIARFDTGIRASGRNVLREVRGLDLVANRDEGLKIRASGVVVDDVRASGNGRDGVSLSGHGNVVRGVVSEGNVRDGLQVRGSATTVEADTSGNRRNGTVVGGRGNTLGGVRSEGNGGAGLVATGAGHEVGPLQSASNAGGDVAGRQGALR